MKQIYIINITLLIALNALANMSYADKWFPQFLVDPDSSMSLP